MLQCSAKGTISKTFINLDSKEKKKKVKNAYKYLFNFRRQHYEDVRWTTILDGELISIDISK